MSCINENRQTSNFLRSKLYLTTATFNKLHTTSLDEVCHLKELKINEIVNDISLLSLPVFESPRTISPDYPEYIIGDLDFGSTMI